MSDHDRAEQRQGPPFRRPESRIENPAAAPGTRLAEAFEAVERFPVLIESRERVIAAATAETARVGDIVAAVEGDVALTIAVLRQANRGGLVAGGIASVPAALEVLKPAGVLALAGTAPSFDFFDSNGGWELKPERFRVHALATQRAADRLGRVVGWIDRDELAVTALLHDVGRLVISRLHPGYKVYFDAALPHPRAAPARGTRAARDRPRPRRRGPRPPLEPASRGSPSRSSAITPMTSTGWRRWSPPPT